MQPTAVLRYIAEITFPIAEQQDAMIGAVTPKPDTCPLIPTCQHDIKISITTEGLEAAAYKEKFGGK